MPDSPRKRRWFGRKTDADEMPPSTAADEVDDALPPEPDWDALPTDDDSALEGLRQSEAVLPLNVPPEEERYPPVRPQALPDQPRRQPAPPPPPVAAAPRRRSWPYNLLTLVLLLGSIGLIVYYAMIWQQPFSSLNLFPPPTPFFVVTATPQGGIAAPTMPTDDPDAPLIIVATETPVTQDTPAAALIFNASEPIYIANTNAEGCNWLSVAGQVQDAAGQPLDGYQVRVIGDDLRAGVFTGAGGLPGSYEVLLADTPTATAFTLELIAPSGETLVGPFPIVTSARCEQNVVQVDFSQVSP